MSTQALDRFREYRDRLVEDLSQKPHEVQMAVVELTSFPRVLMRFGDDPNNAASQMEQLEATHQRGSYLAAFRLAGELLAQSLGAKKTIVLLGDSQQNQWKEGQFSPPFLHDIDVTLPEVTQASVPNLALRNPAVRVYYAGESSVAQCSIEVSRFGSFSSAIVSFVANGNILGTQEIEFSQDAESVMLSGEVEVDRSTWLRGEFRLGGEGDALESDDRVYFSLPPLREGRAVLWAKSVYLRTAMSPDVMQGRWKTRLPAANGEQLPVGLVDEDEVVVAESEQLVHASARDAVLDAINSGRGVVLIMNQSSPLIQGFLHNLGIEVETPMPSATGTPGLRYIYSEHPVFHAFRSADFGDLSDVTVDRYRRLKVTDGLPLVYSQSGDPLLVESRPGKGTLMLFAFDLDRDESNWPLHPTFVPLLDQCLQYVRPEIEAHKTMFEPGARCQWTVSPASKVEMMTVQPLAVESGVEPLRVQVTEAQAEFQAPDRPGHYKILYDDDPDIQGLLDINPPDEESQLSFESAPEALRSWVTTSRERSSALAAERLDTPLTDIEILRQRAWWWLLLAGSVAMVGETIWLCMQKASA